MNKCFKVEVDENGVSMVIHGNVMDISANIAAVLKLIYDKFNKDTKEIFKTNMKAIVNNELYAKTLEELDKDLEELDKDIENRAKATMEKLFNKGLFSEDK